MFTDQANSLPSVYFAKMSDKRKRGVDSNQTDDIVQAALREQQEAKNAKKQPGSVVEHPADKGKTLSDIEEEEGGRHQGEPGCHGPCKAHKGSQSQKRHKRR